MRRPPLSVRACWLTAIISTFLAVPARHSPPTTGWIMLEGGGRLRNAETIRRFVALAGGPHARLVSIDTAALALSGKQYDSAYIATQQKWIREVFGVGNVAVLHAANATEAGLESFVKPLLGATAVWIWGGSREALVKTYVGTRTELEIRKLLARGGAVGGGSAGAMILGAYQVARTVEAVPGNPEGSHQLLLHHPFDRGFGLVPDIAVDVHVAERHREDDLGQIIAIHPELLGVGIDETTALLIHGDDTEVVGEGKVRIWDGQCHGDKRYIVLSPGQHFNLRTRSSQLRRSKAHT